MGDVSLKSGMKIVWYACVYNLTAARGMAGGGGTGQTWGIKVLSGGRASQHLAYLCMLLSAVLYELREEGTIFIVKGTVVAVAGWGLYGMIGQFWVRSDQSTGPFSCSFCVGSWGEAQHLQQPQQQQAALGMYRRAVKNWVYIRILQIFMGTLVALSCYSGPTRKSDKHIQHIGQLLSHEHTCGCSHLLVTCVFGTFAMAYRK
jgi:hypothetical protein